MKPAAPRPDAAVSESISFILLTGILLTAFFIIYTTGMPVYNSYLDESHMSNIEQSFSIIAHNGNTVALHKSPFSSSELKVFGGQLSTRDAGFLNIAYYDGGNNLLGSNNTSLMVLEYTKNQDRVAYVDGGVCRYYQGSGSIMLADPPIFSSPDSLIVPTIVLFNSNLSISGNGLTRISFLTPYYSKMSQTISLPSVANVPASRVDITLGGDYADCLGRYFRDSHGFGMTSNPDGTVLVSKTYPAGVNLQIITSYLTVQAN